MYSACSLDASERCHLEGPCFAQKLETTDSSCVRQPRTHAHQAELQFAPAHQGPEQPEQPSTITVNAPQQQLPETLSSTQSSPMVKEKAKSPASIFGLTLETNCLHCVESLQVVGVLWVGVGQGFRCPCDSQQVTHIPTNGSKHAATYRTAAKFSWGWLVLAHLQGKDHPGRSSLAGDSFSHGVETVHESPVGGLHSLERTWRCAPRTPHVRSMLHGAAVTQVLMVL